jgi:PAS domain S-box-containing protein
MKRKIFLWSALLIISSMLIVSGIITLIGIDKTNKSLKSLQQEILTHINNDFVIFDILLRNIETKMLKDADSKIQKIAKEVISHTKGLLLPDTELRNIADKYDVNDIYIINNEGSIFNTTFSPDLNFNLMTIDDSFAEFLKSIYGKGKVFNSRISISKKTGILNLYSYYSPVGSDYIIESSLRVKDYIISEYSETYYNLLFRDLFVDSVMEHQYIESFDIYHLTDISQWSFLNEGKQYRGEKDIPLKATPKQRIELREGKEVTVWFVPDIENIGFDFAREFYVEIKYDFSGMNTRMINIVLTSGLLYILVLSIIYLIASRIFAGTFLRRIKIINTGLKKIEQGDYTTEIIGDDNDELDEISKNILSMQAKIQEREKVILDREEFNKALFDYSPVETLIVDNDSKIIDVNFAVKHSRKRAPEIGMVMYKDYAGKHRIDMYSELQDCLKSKETKIFLDAVYNNDRSFRITIAPFSGGAIITSEEITEQKQSRERIKNLNSILLAIRNVNQLITQEKDKEVLIDTAVKLLTDTGIYSKAWVGLLNDNSEVGYIAASGTMGDIESFKKFYIDGNITDCAKKAIANSYIHIINNPIVTCQNCPFVNQETDRGTYIVKLEYNKKEYGIFSVSVPFQLVNDPESVGLFEEIAGDLAYAMYNLETEEKHRLAEHSLKKSETLNRTVIEGSPVGISVRDKNGTLLLANHAWRKLWDLKNKEINSYSEKRDELKFDDRDDYLSGHRKKIKDVYVYGGEYYIPELKLNKLRKRKAEWISQIFYAIKDEEGKVSTVVILTEDITERKKNEDKIKRTLKEKDLLLNEVHHRVKNNMQIVLSMLKMQSRKIKDKEVLEMFVESMNRIKSMSLIHERLYLSDNYSRIDFHKYLHDLSRFLQTSAAGGNTHIAFNLDVAEERPDINRAIPCGLIVNELVSNALKFAFPNKESGEINISLQYLEGLFTLIVENNGVPFPQEIEITKSRSLGLNLVKALVDQIHGSLELDKSNGAKFTIKFQQEED